ncbi:NADH dehydrogenase [ubiquinone] 1 beta subcomplex subunit 5 [Dinothrombium tinctorium]|uniref:NADH dehydrogenase [ubiquinone] 1 beta subcomplex subunit 5, mitochondrial n=1 Tax=Dinothrombium tinctorium TaxID=1965070 RepID=A0A3S3P9C8_9ACAR|nr:NADH dehydrogenase [ubiquinone] 1 beta subcomplex subunit 5 [Dinothrombium tinctorium]
MAVLSVCRAVVKANGECLWRVQRRMAGHGRTLPIMPSNFQYNKFKDYLHFYFLVGAVPCALLSLYLGVFYGEAQLAEIPEDYTPKQWEYERNPLSRFLAKYVTYDPQVNYEQTMYKLNYEQEVACLHQIQKQVIDKMSERHDYQAWYYRGFDAKAYRNIRELFQNENLYTGILTDYSQESVGNE